MPEIAHPAASDRPAARTLRSVRPFRIGPSLFVALLTVTAAGLVAATPPPAPLADSLLLAPTDSVPALQPPKRLQHVRMRVARVELPVAVFPPDSLMLAHVDLDTVFAKPEVAVNPGAEVAAELVGSGVASYYGRRFAGRRTASGEVFDPHALTAAHPSLPFGTVVRVTNQRNGKSVLVRITDRGPYLHGRVIDVSLAAAQAIGMVESGTAPVTIEQVERAAAR